MAMIKRQMLWLSILYKIYLCHLYSHAVSHTHSMHRFDYRLPITDTAKEYGSKCATNHSLTFNVASDGEALTIIPVTCTVKNSRIVWQC